MNLNNPMNEENSCEICGKSFAKSAYLKRHQLIHTGDRPYKCKHCGKSFTHNCVKHRHEMIHTGVRPYKCNHCEKSFVRNYNRKKHEEIHARNPFHCDDCGILYKSSTELQWHKEICLGKLPYTGNYNVQGFHTPSSVNRHQEISTGDKLYESEECQSVSNQWNNLRFHERKYHGMPDVQNYREKSGMSSFHNNQQYYPSSNAIEFETYSPRQTFCHDQIEQNTQVGDFNSKKYCNMGGNLFVCKFCRYTSDTENKMILHVIDHKSIVYL